MHLRDSKGDNQNQSYQRTQSYWNKGPSGQADRHNQSYQMDYLDGDNTADFNQISFKKSENGRGPDDSKSFHIDIGKFKIQDNYMYGGSGTDLDESISHSFDEKR